MNLKLKIFLPLALVMVFMTGLNAQKVLTLDECIKLAMENNIGLKRSQNSALIAKSNQFQALMNFLPNVSGFANYNWIDGTNFDNSSGQFFTGSFQNSNPSITASLLVFNGFSNHHIKKSTTLALEASTHQVNEQKQVLKSTVLNSYLSVILDKENIRISNDRIKLLEAQLTRERKRESVGVGNLEQVYNFQSQLANEKLTKINLENTYKSDLLQLLQSLQIDVSKSYEIAPADISNDQVLLEVEEFPQLLNSSLQYSPGLKRASISALSAKYNFKSTQASMSPTLRVFGNWGTQFSSNNRDTEGEIPLFDQYQNLTSTTFGIRLNVPIFNNYINRNNTQVAKINMSNADLDLKQAELDITNTIQRVYLDLVSAQETYKAAQENLVALNQSYEFVNTRYRNGNTDFFTYLESLNNKNRAEIELVNAKYAIVFRKKILDIYKGLF